ncbi:hypothetical protein G5C51_20055 [Streptomyces sp. A7024]|uniref:Uncharacterized protein n=1 Tax=Streptomyces coryli TaxID=1128680 RepID=A0A6G4U1N7_9ACTN|nr:hypothetical protein [Streptomyces coryli]NGN66179.1 hypothetical protein [Streptomyces coryli]
MNTEVRSCLECGSTFHWTSRNPTRKFCGDRCKARWWRAHQRGKPTAVAGGPAPAPPLGAAHECPNCGRHITVISLLVAGET